MKKYFPSENGIYRYLQTNRGDILGNLWSTFNIDFQTNPGAIRLSDKLVINTNSDDDSDLGRPAAFAHWYGKYWAVCGDKIFKTADESLTGGFTQFDNPMGFTVGASETQFDVTNPAGTTYRYTYNTVGTDPLIDANSFPVGATVRIVLTGLATANEGTFVITGSGANYFEVTNATPGTVESNKTIGSGYISVSSGTFATAFGSDISDLKVFNGRLWVTSRYGLYSMAFDNGNSPWILRVSFTSTSSHQMAYLKNFNRLYFKNSVRQIGSIDTSDVVSNTPGNDYCIEIENLGNGSGSNRIIACFEATTDRIYIGTQIRNNAAISGTKFNGSIQDWDGISSQATTEYELSAAAVLSIINNENITYAIDSEGRILQQNGYAFSEIARLPIDRTLLTNATIETDYPNTPVNGRFVHYNGMVATKNNTILMLVKNLNDNVQGNTNENLPSGIWELDIATKNFIHRYSFTHSRINDSTVSDFGQWNIAGAGAIELATLSTTNALGRPTILCGASYYTNATDISSGIYIDSPASPTTDTQGARKGSFVTTWYQADDIADKWMKLWATYKRFKNENTKITFKYRLEEEVPIIANVTWTTAKTFTTTTDLTGLVGYEVEIIQGTGSGSCVHIVSVTGSGTYTVTLEEDINGILGDTGIVRVQNWTKILPVITGSYPTLNSYEKMPISKVNTRIQIKGHFEFFDEDEFHKFVLFSNDEIKAAA